MPGKAPGAGGAGDSAGPGSPSPDTGGQAANPQTANPALRAALGQLTMLAQGARQYAQAYPQCASEMRQVGELLQRCLMKTTSSQQGSEPPTPPV
jgi:hypothetical protein